MNEHVWNKFIKDICAYFEKKLAKETGEIWYQETNNIPEESIFYISSQIKKKESFPRNFPATAWALYYQWLKENPQKQAHNEQCPDCVNGWITAQKPGENSKAFKCASCNPDDLVVSIDAGNLKGQIKVATRTLEQILGAGYLVDGKKQKQPQDWHNQF